MTKRKTKTKGNRNCNVKHECNRNRNTHKSKRKKRWKINTHRKLIQLGTDGDFHFQGDPNQNSCIIPECTWILFCCTVVLFLFIHKITLQNNLTPGIVTLTWPCDWIMCQHARSIDRPITACIKYWIQRERNKGKWNVNHQ